MKEMTEKKLTNDWQNIVRRMFGRRRKVAKDTEYDIHFC